MIFKWNAEDKMINKRCIDEVIARIQDIDDPDAVGVIAAQEIIDLVLENLAPVIYNKAISESAKLLKEKLDEFEYSLEELKQV